MSQTDNSLPIVDDIYSRRVFGELTNMEVELDADPLQYGPKRLNAKVAQTRNFLDRCQRIYLQVAEDLHMVKRAHRASKIDFDLQVQDMIANDPEVRAGKSIQDRMALSQDRLRPEMVVLTDMESSIQDLESIMEVIRAKTADLKDVQGRIRDQVKLCQEETGLGNRWGSTPGPIRSHHVDIDNAPRYVVPPLTPAEEVLGRDGQPISDLDKFIQTELTAQGREDEIYEAPPIVDMVLAQIDVPDSLSPSSEDEDDVSALLGNPATVTPPVVPTVPVDTNTQVSDPDDFDMDAFIQSQNTPAAVLPVASVPVPVAVVPEDVLLTPLINPKPLVATALDIDADDFFKELNLDAPVSGSTASTSPSFNEIDLDDLIGGL